MCQVSDEKYDLINNAQTQYTDYKKWGGKRVAWKDAKPGDMFYYSHNSGMHYETFDVDERLTLCR